MASAKNNVVLVAIVKNKRDLDLVLKEKWYRIPAQYLPKQKFKYLAFYQPASGKLGKKIIYYAKIKKVEPAKRLQLLPKEKTHPRAKKIYWKFNLGKISKLHPKIANRNNRRVTFCFTTLSNLKKAKDILELYQVPPIEEIFEKALKKTGLKYIREYPISTIRMTGFRNAGKQTKYRLDFAIFDRDQKIAIECDEKKSHNSAAQKIKDKAKDKFLGQNGWRVLRLTEKEILENIDNCLNKIKLNKRKARKNSSKNLPPPPLINTTN